MFNFIEDIAALTGLDFEILNGGYRIINFDGKSVYVEGFVNITSFDTAAISVKLKKGMIKVSGEGLLLKYINLNSIIINGKISNVEVG